MQPWILSRGSEPRRSSKSRDYADALRTSNSNVLDRKPWTEKIEQARHAIEISTAWRVEGTLREFAKFKPINMWFSYPVHFLDDSGVLADIQLEENKPGWIKAKETRKKNAKEDKKQKLIELDEAVENANFGEPPSKEEVAEYLGISVKQLLAD